MPLYEFHILGVPTSYCHAFVLVFIWTRLPNPDGFVSAASGQELSFIAPSNALDFIFVAFELRYLLKASFRSHLPDAGCPVKGTRSQDFPTGMPCYAPDSSLVAVSQNRLSNQ